MYGLLLLWLMSTQRRVELRSSPEKVSVLLLLPKINKKNYHKTRQTRLEPAGSLFCGLSGLRCSFVAVFYYRLFLWLSKYHNFTLVRRWLIWWGESVDDGDGDSYPLKCDWFQTREKRLRKEREEKRLFTVAMFEIAVVSMWKGEWLNKKKRKGER